MRTRSAGSSDTVNIIFEISWNPKIKDVGNPLDIQTSGCHIRCHQYLDFHFFKAAYYLVSLSLAHIPMEFFHHNIRFFSQTFSQTMGFILCIAENNTHKRIHFFQMSDQQRKLMFLCRFINPLFYCGRRFLFCHVNTLRIGHVFPRQPDSILRHGSGQQDELALFRSLIHQGFDIFSESGSQHLIRFIQYNHFYGAQIQCTATDMIQQSSRSTNDNMWISLQLLNLIFDCTSANDISRVHPTYGSQRFQHIKDLFGQFTGRRQNQRLYFVPFRLNTLHERKKIGQCLSCAGLRFGYYISPFKYGRNGFFLYRSSNFYPLFVQYFGKCRNNTKGCK